MPTRERLPPAVYALALRLGADPGSRATRVQLRQTGRMREIDASRWMNFRARQTISTLRCAFEWHARTGAFGMIGVRDALTDSGGHLDVHAFGCIPLVRTRPSPALLRGELMRYLAELPWAPNAILLNPSLRWREDGADALIVSAGDGDAEAEVRLTMDPEGRILSAFAPDRPRSVKAGFLPTPWRGHFSDYRRHGGRWIPFAGEVGWEIEGRETVYWQGRIVHWETVNDP